MKKINAEAFEAFVLKAFKLSTEEMASLYNDAGELTDFTLIEKKDTERVAKLATEKTNQFNRGLKEGAGKLEKELKEKYDVESDLIGVELFDHIIETKLTEAKGSDDKDFTKHPEYIKLQNQHTKEIKALKKEHEDQLREKEDQVNYSNLFAEVKNNALAEFRALNPVLSEDPKKATAQEGIIVRELERYKYRKENDVLLVLKPDGTAFTDDHGHTVTFADHVKGLAEPYFDFKASTEKTSPGNRTTPGGTPSKKVRMPKDANDYVEMMRDNSLTPKERIEIKDLWTSKNKQT